MRDMRSIQIVNSTSVEQVTQVEIDAGEVQMVAVVTATDSQEEAIDVASTKTIPLDRDSGLSLGEVSS